MASKKEKYTPEKIVELRDDWRNYFYYNDVRGYITRRFLLSSSNEKLFAEEFNKKDTDFSFNYLHRIQRQRESELADLEFSLNLTNKIEEKDHKLHNYYKEGLEYFLLHSDHLEAQKKAFKLKDEHGYSAIYLDLKLEDNTTLQYVPCIKALSFPEMAFWDKCADDPFKIKGRYCGITKVISKDTFVQIYPNAAITPARPEKESEETVEVIDFWYKDIKKCKYFLTKEEKYVREDQLTEDTPLHESGAYEENNVEIVYFMRVTEHEVLEKPAPYLLKNYASNWIFEDLPVYFFGESKCVKEHPTSEYEEHTFPYLWHLIEPQRLYNLVSEELSKLTKKMSARQYITGTSAIKGKEEYWDNPSSKEGVLLINEANPAMGSSPSGPVVIPPEKVTGETITLLQFIKQSLFELAGISFADLKGEGGKVSGIALQERISQGNLLHKPSIKSLEQLMMSVAKVIKRMLPSIIVNEYRITTNTNQLVIFNKRKFGGEIEHPLKEVLKQYNVHIETSPATPFENTKLLNTCLQIMSIAPEIKPYIIDEVFGLINVKNKSVIEKRMELIVPKLVKAYGDGMVSREQFEEAKVKAGQMQQEQSEVTLLAKDIESRAQLKQEELKLKDKQIRTNTEIAQMRHTDNMQAQQGKLNLELMKHDTKIDGEVKTNSIKQLQKQNQNLNKYVAYLEKKVQR